MRRRNLIAAAVVLLLGFVSLAAVLKDDGDRFWILPPAGNTLVRGDAANATSIAWRYGCASCHTIAGISGASGRVGPALVKLRERPYLAGRIRNTPENLVRWITDPRTVDPETAMPTTGISPGEARDMAAFLYDH